MEAVEGRWEGKKQPRGAWGDRAWEKQTGKQRASRAAVTGLPGIQSGALDQ